MDEPESGGRNPWDLRGPDDLCSRPWVGGHSRAVVASRCQELQPDVVVDLGAGSGDATSACPFERILVDTNESLMAVSGVAECIRADLEVLDLGRFRDAAFVARQVMHYITSPARLVVEALRAPGSVGVVIAQIVPNPFSPEEEEWWCEMMQGRQSARLHSLPRRDLLELVEGVGLLHSEDLWREVADREPLSANSDSIDSTREHMQRAPASWQRDESTYWRWWSVITVRAR